MKQKQKTLYKIFAISIAIILMLMAMNLTAFANKSRASTSSQTGSITVTGVENRSHHNIISTCNI